jgi:pimeloyl-ACP methyl ester carboxylesterase
MKTFTSFDGISIAYHEWGEITGVPPVVLHHGFIADAVTNWVGPGVVAALVTAGRRVIGIDARGHGSSDKPHDPRHYADRALVRDLFALFDLLEAPAVDLVGYSLGGHVAAVAAASDARVHRLVISGVGASLAEHNGVGSRDTSREQIAAILRTEHPENFAGSSVSARSECQRAPQSRTREPLLLAFRTMADALGADRTALAALIGADHLGSVALDRITAPTLVLCGRDDALATRPEVLAAAIPGARARVVGGDHLTALRDPEYVPALVEFLNPS